MSDEAEHGKYLEDRARSLGLPTDPEAYQDGGVGVAATAYNAVEADVLAAFLNQAGVPAWVDSPNVARLYGWAPGYLADGVRVFVPLGRLADAKRILSKRTGRRGRQQPEARRMPRSKVGAIFLLAMGVVGLFSAIDVAAGERGSLEIGGAVCVAVVCVFSLTLCVAGAIALRPKPEPQD